MADSGTDRTTTALVPIRGTNLAVIEIETRSLAKRRGKTPKAKKHQNLVKRGDIWTFVKRIKGTLYRASMATGDLATAIERAVAYEASIRAKLRDGANPRDLMPSAERRTMTVGEWYIEYARRYRLTHPRYPEAVDQLSGFVRDFARQSLASITLTECQAWIDRLVETKHQQGVGYAPNTIRVLATKLSSMFKSAVKFGKIPSNPWQGIERPKQTPRARTLSEDEEDRLLALASPEVRRALELILGSALRHSELRALRPCDVFTPLGETPYLFVRSGKGDKAREVIVSPQVVAIIEQQRQARGLSRTSTEPLWSYARGSLNVILAKLCEQAGIDRSTRDSRLWVHDLRRTYGTRAGLDPLYPHAALADNMGHVSTAMTSRFYQHTKRQQRQQALAAVFADPRSPLHGRTITKAITRRKTRRVS